MQDLILTKHARERVARRFGKAFNVDAALARARPMTGREFREHQRRQKRFGRGQIQQQHRHDCLVDPQSRAAFITTPGHHGGRVVVTVLRLQTRAEFIQNANYAT